MQKVLRLLMAGALGGIAGPAIAAEMGGPVDPPVLPVLPMLEPVFTWTGFYGGVNLGYGWTHRSTQVSFGTPSPSPVGFSGGNNGAFQTANNTPQGFPIFPQFTVTMSSDVGGVVGGGQFGANWQFGSIVLGAEADAQVSSQRKAFTGAMPVGSLIQDYSQPWFITFRGRAGWAFTGGWLAYATGGGAWLDSDRTFSTAGMSYTPSSFELSHIGWSAGLGVEKAIASNWSWKLEYLHTNTGNFTTTVNFLGFQLPWKTFIGDDIVRIGVNYRL
jgi:outer membrane immunogenic protein